MHALQRIAIGLAALLALIGTAGAQTDSLGSGPTPPRLSFIDGRVSFWRPGAPDWSAATLNTPLAPGDALYAGDKANLEVQIGSRAFVRAGENTEIVLVNRAANFFEFRVADGEASFDLRTLPAGLSVEVDTPNAAFTIDRNGYYRLNVAGSTTLFITRRGGRATVIPAGGQALSVAPSEELVVEGTDRPTAETYVAPEVDSWDQWNYARTEHLVDTLSARYLPSDVYGAESLDQYGDWRVVPDYGAVWVPSGVPSDWTPYSTGDWIWDPYYGWTWIDSEPWGWTPFHYGRWVHLDRHWAWAPGPAVTRSRYAPALVAFLDPHGTSFGITPGLGWVALSWGEPLLPWWGGRGFAGKPWWGGWGGPRMVNNAVVGRGVAVNASGIIFQNTRVRDAVVAVDRDHFGHGRLHAAPVPAASVAQLTPLVGSLPVTPTARSLAAGPAAAVRPSGEVLSKPTVTVRPPAQLRLPWQHETPAANQAAPTPQLRLVTPLSAGGQSSPAPFGSRAGAERQAPSQPPRFEEMRRAATPGPQPQTIQPLAPRREEAPSIRPAVVAPPAAAPQFQAPSREQRREELGGHAPAATQPAAKHEEPRALPGEPANRLAPERHHTEGAPK